MLPLDEYSASARPELSSSASAPQRPFHRPQDVVAGHPKRRPGAQTAIDPPRGLTWAGSERAQAPASPSEAAAICGGDTGMDIAARGVIGDVCFARIRTRIELWACRFRSLDRTIMLLGIGPKYGVCARESHGISAEGNPSYLGTMSLSHLEIGSISIKRVSRTSAQICY